jgi:tetratricopeptide (TPR) repeat protein
MAALDSALPCPLPARADDDAEALQAFRKEPADERAFTRARRLLREAGDWRSMAKLLVEHAAAISGEPDKLAKVAEHAIQAYELFVERVRDPEAAAHALARALLAQPENERVYERLYASYQQLDWVPELALLLSWRMNWARKAQPSLLAGLYFAYAELQRTRFFAIGEAVEHYEQALAQDPMLTAASDQLIDLHLHAGAWQRAVRLMEGELSQLEAHPSYAQDPAVAARISELHLRLARIAFDLHQDLPSSARHLQAAIKTTPQNLAALRAFGTLYLGSGKASDEGLAKASGIFLKAAQLARAAGDSTEALKLLRRTLSLRPDHFDAAQLFAELLAEQAHWMELDEHYRHMLTYVQGPPRVQILLSRAANLDQRLSRREEARVCYEEAGQYQTADGEAWAALERIYRASADWAALATLLEWKVEQLGAAVPTASLLEAAKVFHYQLDDHERAALFYFKVLEREPFQPEAFEGYKEHFRRKHAWTALRDLVLYQIEQATAARNAGQASPLDSQEFAREFIELAEVCERRLGDVDGAVDAWHRMSVAYPHDPQSREHMARIQKRTRMWDNMVRVQEAELARSADPRKRLEIIKRLAQIYRDRQVHPQRAIELYTEMAHLAPGDLGAIRALTSLYDRAGDHHQVIELLKQQYEVAQNEGERVSLLRRMAELWHHELHAYPEAMWACEEILALTGNDLEALHRLQLLAQETNDLELLIAGLEREHKVTGKADGKAQILRRLARVAENRLNDRDRAAGYWSRLHDLEPDNLEVIDKVISVYESTGRFEELAELLGKAAASSKTPIIRQLDYLLRLGYLAQAGLGDPDLARSAYERVIKIRPDHRGALDALATLYRVEEDYEGLAEILGKQRELADSDEEAFALGWEQADLLLHQVDDAVEAASVLADIARNLRPGDIAVNRALLDAYQAAGLREQLIGHAELMLLGTADAGQRGELHDLIIATWQALENKRAAMRATERRLREFPNDPRGHAQLAELQEELGDFELALRSLARKLELVVHDPDQQIATLRRMAEIADLGLADRNRALELLRRASGIDPTDPELRDHIEQFAEAHGTWKELLEIDELRINRLTEMGDIAGQLDICTEASRIAEEQLDDADRAFAWARRGYFIARQQQLDFDQGLRRLRKLAEGYTLWTALLEVTERELERQTFTDQFELVERMIDAAEIAENKLDDPRRAVVYLQRALREQPDEEEVTRRIQTIAESHELWDALLDLAEHRLDHAEAPLGRFDALCAISRIHERKLDDPRAAFRTLRRAWEDLLGKDNALAEEALDMAINMAESNKLWRELADHHAALARERSDAGKRIEAVDSLAEAARIVDERLEDPISAMRVLLRGVVLDREGEVILPRLRELAARVDRDAVEKGAHEGVRIGALVELRASSDRIAAASSTKAKVELLAERAEIREQRLEDGVGALAEWIRILTIDPFHAGARDEAERIAGRYDLWLPFMVIPAWELERAGAGGRQQELQVELADLYEHKLNRAEYAFRSRLEAWRRTPSLPPRTGELGDPHRDLWRLAGVVGAYRGPALPKDPMLEPSIPQPEQRDRMLWTRARLDPQHLTAPGGSDSAGAIVARFDDPHAEGTHEELTAVAPIDELQEVSRVELVEDSIVEISRVEMIPTVDSVVEEVSHVELMPLPGDSQISEVSVEFLDEIEELEDLEEVSSAELESATVSGEIGKRATSETPAKARAKHDLATERFGRKTIPLPKPIAPAEDSLHADSRFDLARGLPPVPKLAGPILAPRPSVGSAWEELANAYAELPTANKEQKVEVQLACARLWEEGADKLDRAFACHERALQLIPERPESVASLEALAGRHEARARLLRAWEQLLNEAALPEHVIALNLRIAEFHERDGRLDPAEGRYRAVLAVDPSHLGALRKLLTVYDELDRRPQYVETYADLLNVERNTIDDDERVVRSLRLEELYEDQGRSDEALELLRFLVRDFPERPEVHGRLRDLLLRRREWVQAIDAMRTANEELYDPDLRADNLARIAEVYQQKLELPDRAIEAWNDYRSLRPDDDRPLAELQQLYLETTRWEKLLPIIDARLEQLADDTKIDEAARQAARVKLLVVKARALQEGLGDEPAATRTLEQLAADAPDDDEVALGLSRLYRRTDRFDEGVALLRSRVDRLSANLAEQPGNARRIIDLSKTLARILHEEGKRHAAALELIRTALELDRDDRELLALRTKLARALNDLPLLADGLERLAEPDGLLEAAELARKRLAEPARAEANYRRVLDRAKHEQQQLGKTTPGVTGVFELEAVSWTARLTGAIEGLVRLRIDAGDLVGATAFMDEQLAALQGDSLRARLLTEIGRITYRTTGDVAAARARFDAALAIVPDHAEARLGLGELLFDAGDLGEAERQLERAVDALGLVRDHAHLVEGLVLLARTLEATDRSGEAYRRLTTALRHDPDDLSIRLAVVRNRLGARRHRDVLTAVDQLDQRLAARELPRGGREAKLAAEIFAIGGECELESKQPDKAYERLQQALEFDPDNRRALAMIIPWLQDRGEIVDAARYAARLAEALEDPHARGSAWVDAGMLYHEAAQMLEDGELEDAPAQVGGGRELTDSERRTRIAELEREAFECVRVGLVLVSDSPTPVLDPNQLEVAFRASATHDRALALRCLERLLLRDFSSEQRLELLLEGVRTATPPRTSESHTQAAAPSRDDSGPRPSIELALAYADRAIELAPQSSAAVLAKAEVLEAAGRAAELQALVSSFLARLDSGERGASEVDEDLSARINLLIRLAAIQREQTPAEAAATLQEAARLTARMRNPELSSFGFAARQQLAELYERLAATDNPPNSADVIANHRGLLSRDPLHLPSLRALANHHRERTELQRALAVVAVIALLDPADEAAKQFLAEHREAPGGEAEELDVAAITGELPTAAGVPESLMQLWESGQSLIAEHFEKLEFDAKARVSPIGDGALAQAWRDVLRRVGQTKVALVADPALDRRTPIDEHPALAWAEPHCQLPPILIASARARSAGDEDRAALEFALARGVYLTRPEVVMVAGQTRSGFSILTSAMLLAFHPRHAQRKQAARNVDDPVGKLGHEFARKLPIRVARQIGGLFKDHEHEQFDSRVFRTWIRRAADRVGLLVCGDLRAALGVLAGADLFAEADPRAAIAANPDLLALIAFAVSGAHADARRRLGFVVAGDAAPSERTPAPPITVGIERRSSADEGDAGVPRRRIRADTSRIRLAVAKDAATRETSGPMRSTLPVAAAPLSSAPGSDDRPLSSSTAAVARPAERRSPSPIVEPKPAAKPVEELDELDDIADIADIADTELEPEPAVPAPVRRQTTEPAPVAEPEPLDEFDDVDLDLAGDIDELEMDDVDLEA